MAHMRSLSTHLANDTIHLYSPPRDTADPMSGRALGADERAFFRPFYPQMLGGDDVFAIGYTELAPGITAYILRVPSAYDATAIDLWIHNDQEGFWLPPVNVADAYGDEGWKFQQDAWLVDHNRDGHRDLVYRRTDWDEGRVLTDSLSWRFWQTSFAVFGWRQTLGDDAAKRAYALHRGDR